MAYDRMDQFGRPVRPVLPKVPGMNASAMGLARTIGHTPWRAAAPRDPATDQVTGQQQPPARLQPRPTSGRYLQSGMHAVPPRKTSNRTTSRNRAARAARSRAAKRAQ